MMSAGKVERGGDKPFHTVINAENFHALQLLLYTHEGKVDAIYIDPPYNSGARDWKYNNDYVDSEDAYRHSKWLAMMERRLRLARRLLNPEGSALIVAIDERELHRLGLLLEQVFEDAEIQMVTDTGALDSGPGDAIPGAATPLGERRPCQVVRQVPGRVRGGRLRRGIGGRGVPRHLEHRLLR